MEVLSLTDYRPSPRFDAEPWTQARIEQSTTKDGTWTTLETITLNPVDADPENPAYRNFTFDYEVVNGEWFRVVFVDADGNEQPTSAVFAGSATWMPTSNDIAAVLRARTKPSDGQDYLGIFNASTRPTGRQVDALIEQAAQQILAAFASGAVPESSWEAARQAAILKTAVAVEESYFPEQVDQTGSTGTVISLRLQAEAAMKVLVDGANVRALLSEAA